MLRYLYTYILIYVYTYILIYLYTYILIYLYNYILIYWYTYMLIYVYTYLLIYLYTYILIYWYTDILIYLYNYILIYSIYRIIYLFTYILIYLYIYIFINIYSHTAFQHLSDWHAWGKNSPIEEITCSNLQLHVRLFSVKYEFYVRQKKNIEKSFVVFFVRSFLWEYFCCDFFQSPVLVSVLCCFCLRSKSKFVKLRVTISKWFVSSVPTYLFNQLVQRYSNGQCFANGVSWRRCH